VPWNNTWLGSADESEWPPLRRQCNSQKLRNRKPTTICQLSVWRTIYEPGRVRVVKLVFTAGTWQACNGGLPACVVGLRHSDAVAGLTSEGYTVLSSGSAYTW
jgi:hypothetical protein